MSIQLDEGRKEASVQLHTHSCSPGCNSIGDLQQYSWYGAKARHLLLLAVGLPLSRGDICKG